MTSDVYKSTQSSDEITHAQIQGVINYTKTF